jgi:hypothetical protein
MKSIVFLFFIFTILLYVFWHDISIKYIRYGGINESSHAISLRTTPNLSAKVIAQLKPRNFSELKEPKSKWIHYYTLKNNLYVRKKDFTLGYTKIFDTYIVKEKVLNTYKNDLYKLLPIFISILGLIFLFLVGLSIFKKNRKKNEEKEPISIEVKEKIIIKEVSVNDTKLISEHKTLKDEYMTLQNKLEQIEKVNKQNSKTLEFTKKLLKEKNSKELERIEKEFYQKAKKEIDAVYKNDISEMEIHVSNLVKKYNEAKENALILGVDIEGSKISNLVKGRLFEIFSARIWNDDYRTIIKDWTPDKGFNEKIYVESNGNPDFVIYLKEKDISVSVECKYRSKFTTTKFSQQNIFTNFDKNHKIERYKKYQQKSGIKVYILLGIEGIPEKPKYLYLVPLDELDKTKINYSSFDNFMTTKNKLESYKIQADTLIDMFI